MFHCHIYKWRIKKRNKQQSLAGRINKLGGPEFEKPLLHFIGPIYDIHDWLHMSSNARKGASPTHSQITVHDDDDDDDDDDEIFWKG